MSTTKILRCWASITGRRFINQSAKRLESKASDGINKASSSTVSSHSESVAGPRMMSPSNFDKWVLVWMKKFPKGEVPSQIKEDLMYQTKSRARVKAANYMTALAVLGCIVAAISGKKAAKSGDTIQKRNLDWHQKLKDEHDVQIQKTKS